MSQGNGSKKGNKWASDDDATNLLAGILDETEEVAQAEEARLESELQRRAEAERQRALAKEQERLAEAERRLAAERERVVAAEQRRTQKMEALRIEDLKERGEWVDPAEIARAEAEEQARREAEAERARTERAKEQAALIAAQQNLENERLSAPAKGSSGIAMFALAIAMALLIGGVGTAAVVFGGYKLDATTYTKSVYRPADQRVTMVEAGFTPLPKPALIEAAPDRERPATRTNRPSTPATSTPKPKNDDAAKKRAEELQKMLENSDSIFGDD